MIIVRLMGGLGNQMFQYAFGRAISLKYETELILDLSFLKEKNRQPGFVYRDYDLDIFNINIGFDLPKQYYVVSERKTSYDSDFFNNVGNASKNNNILVQGYFQSPLYFESCIQEIKKDFEFVEDVRSESDPSILSLLNDIISSNSIMINFRRSDYLNNDFHGVIGLDYMNNAIEKLNQTNPKFFVFSDDIEWCKENLGDNFRIIDHTYKGHKFGKYLQLMKHCKHFIIPNSTFAWWAAELSSHVDKKVIAPLKWTQDQNWDSSDLIPKNWIRI